MGLGGVAGASARGQPWETSPAFGPAFVPREQQRKGEASCRAGAGGGSPARHLASHEQPMAAQQARQPCRGRRWPAVAGQGCSPAHWAGRAAAQSDPRSLERQAAAASSSKHAFMAGFCSVRHCRRTLSSETVADRFAGRPAGCGSPPAVLRRLHRRGTALARRSGGAALAHSSAHS